MKIVIDIPKKTYDEIKERNIITCGEFFAHKLVNYIKNGIPLTEWIEEMTEKFRQERGETF